MTLRPAVAVVALALAACSRGGGAVDAGAEGATTNANTNATSNANANPTSTSNQNPTPSPAPTPPPGPSPLPVSAAVAKTPAGDQPLSRDGVTLVDPGAAFRVEIAAHLTDARLSIHDEQDAMVASSGTTEVGDTWTRFELAPDEPLRPGSSFALRVDGAAQREAHDAAGNAYAPVVLKLKTTGERPAPPSRPAKKKKRHR